jgi:hypothetical protein
MKIRFLKIGEDAKWFCCIGEHGDPFTNSSDFRPSNYIVAEEKNNFKGCMEIFHIKSRTTILFNPQANINPSKVLRKIIVKGLKTFEKNDMIVLIHDDNRNLNLLCGMLPDLGFKLKLEKALYRLLPDNAPVNLITPTNVIFRSLKQLGKKSFLNIFSTIYNPDRDFTEENPVESFNDLIEQAKEMGTYCPQNWFVVYVNKNPTGIILPQLHDKEKKLGSNFYLGIVPTMRGRGYGRILQYYAIQKLMKEGVHSIVGSTDTKNIKMRKIFDSLNYDLETIQYIFHFIRDSKGN